MKVANVTKEAKKPSKAKLHQSPAKWAAQCAVAFVLVMDEGDTLAMYAERYRVARLEARETVRMAHDDIGDGAPWQAFLGLFADELVTAKVCATKDAAARLIRNALIALKLTGRGTKKGGRKAKTATGSERNVTTEAPSIIVAALAYISKAQEKHAGDGEVTEMLGEIAAILGAGK